MRRMIVGAVSVLLLAGCGGGDDGPEATPAPASQQGVPEAARAATLAGLRAIDPGLVANEDRALRHADNACEAVADDTGKNSDVESVRLRFDGGMVSVDAAMAEKILAVLKASYCPHV